MQPFAYTQLGLNNAVEERREASIERLNSAADAVLSRVIVNKSIFTVNDIKRELKFINDNDKSEALLK